ncbi:hypothetical protein [Maribellus sediminis]|uniref:hypothetical protein n=1 Tax=Maribellus sediminis TaxID=2696285 RepID=UPI001431EDEF|nr:hypothetical protein [Maribellus sediminis]
MTKKKRILRILFLFMFLFSGLVSEAQHEAFLIEGRIVDQNGMAIPDVYVVNLRNHDKDISRDNGVFTIWVTPSDSLVLSHISYIRKVVRVQTILVNPMIEMYSEHINVPEIRVSPEQISDLDRANDNLKFINQYEVPAFTKISADQQNPVSAVITENNRQMRVEAASVSIVRFSPSDVLGKVFVKARNDRTKDYHSTRQVKEPPKEIPKEGEN